MRIIAGTARGRRLRGPTGTTTRPMTDRAREGLFSAIAAEVGGATVFDLYAGSGSLGLEALSRGAASVTFVERDRAALAALRSNVDTLGLGGDVVAGEVDGFLRSAGSKADLAFVDPPYDLSLPSVVEVMSLLVELLSDEAVVVLHRRVGEAPPRVQGLRLEAERAYGTAQIWRYRAADEKEQA